MRLPFLWTSCALASLTAACGGDDADPGDPTNVPFGTTAIVVVVNPIINDANQRTGLPTPGPTIAGVTLTTDDGITATTGADGVAVLAPVTAGARTVTVSGAIAGGSFSVMAADKALREVAIAATPGSAQLMIDVDYKADQAFEVTPTMTNAEVNAVLAVSDRVVFFRGGTYAGDLTFGGSRVTLFGEGALGGQVTLDGDLTITGSDSRIRGTHITGAVTIPGSGVGIAFSRVDGTLTANASDGMLLNNALCGDETVTGSGTIVVGNHGAAPATACP